MKHLTSFILTFTILLIWSCESKPNKPFDPNAVDSLAEAEEDYPDEDITPDEADDCFKIPYVETSGGLKIIPVRVNGMPLDMIYDTGPQRPCFRSPRRNIFTVKACSQRTISSRRKACRWPTEASQKVCEYGLSVWRWKQVKIVSTLKTSLPPLAGLIIACYYWDKTSCNTSVLYQSIQKRKS